MSRATYGQGSGVEPHAQDASYRTYTYQDAIDRTSDFVTSGGGNGQNRIIKQSVLEAYEELCNCHDWNYFYKLHRVSVYAAVTGTCAYTSSTRILTIDSGTWPTWATQGAVVRIDNVNYLVRDQASTTTLLLDEVQCPSEDIATGTSFSVFRLYYGLPSDFRAMSRPLDSQGDYWSYYVSPEEWARSQQYNTQTSTPWCWTVMGDPHETGRMCVAVSPGYDTDRTIDMMIQKSPRPLIYDGNQSFCRTGTVSVSTATVTGSSTAFESNMAGAVLRIARSGSTTCPDGAGGNNPYERQAYISQDGSITSTGATIEGSWSGVSARKYTISDPIDLSPQMINAFFRGCEYKISTKLNLKTMAQAERLYLMALATAKSADSPARVTRSCWDNAGAVHSKHRPSTRITDDF